MRQPLGGVKISVRDHGVRLLELGPGDDHGGIFARRRRRWRRSGARVQDFGQPLDFDLVVGG